MRRIFLCISLISLFSIATFGQNKKVITNFDLEKYRQQRVQADADYDRKVEAGVVPTKAELEKREQERQKFISDFSQKATVARNQAENYWQSQAYALRTEIASVEAEINYVGARVAEIPRPQVYYSVGYLPYGYGGYGDCCYGGAGLPQYPAHRSYQRPNAPLPAANPGGVYANLMTRQPVGGSVYAPNLNAPQANLTFGGIPYQPGILTAPFTLQTPENYTREELLDRLRLLEQQRAGLYARFEVLQDEAQQQGVNIN